MPRAGFWQSGFFADFHFVASRVRCVFFVASFGGGEVQQPVDPFVGDPV